MTEIPRVVYATWTLADLDWLHEYAGLGSEWLESGRRAEMVELAHASGPVSDEHPVPGGRVHRGSERPSDRLNLNRNIQELA